MTRKNFTSKLTEKFSTLSISKKTLTQFKNFKLLNETEAKIKNLTEILVECKELFDVTFVGDSQCRLRVKLIEALKEGYKHEI